MPMTRSSFTYLSGRGLEIEIVFMMSLLHSFHFGVCGASVTKVPSLHLAPLLVSLRISTLSRAVHNVLMIHL